MNGDVFRNWFQSVIKLLPKESVVVLDNAPYHSVQLERIPNNSWRKDDIAAWLTNKGIGFEQKSIRPELLGIVRQHENKFKKFVIDEMAREHGHFVLRLPPYHCVLNPIEMIWSQVKGYVARNNHTFKMNEVSKLLQEGVVSVTAVNWKNCVNHVIQEEKEMWEMDNITDVLVDEIVINPSETTDDSSDNY